MKKIKILETIRQGQVGGGETHVFDLVNSIDKNLFDVHVLSFTDGPMVDKLKSIGIKTFVINTLKPFDVRIWGKVKMLMIENNYDIIHAHGTRAASNVFYAANSLNKPMIYTVHGWSFHDGQSSIVRRVRELSEKFLTNRSSLTITVSNSNQCDGINRFDLKRSRVIYNGIDSTRFNSEGLYKNIREEFNIPSSKTLVSYLVRMTYQKDPITMINAIKVVTDKCDDIVFFMVGNGDMQEQTIQLAKELKVCDKIIFSDFRSDIPDLLNASDIYCLPSLWEGMPIGLLEAMAMNKACIATGVDGTRELIQDGENGVLVPIRDYKELANAILDLHYDGVKRKRIAKKANDFVKSNFSLKTMVKNIENQYLQLLTTNNF
jgi:glycosyltransferase involved in cell wall biosynthesis